MDMMNIGTNDRDHPISSPVNMPSPRQPERQHSLELGYPVNYSPSHSPISPQCLDKPFDDRSHNRRPSDEASMILRKISSSGNSGISPFMYGNILGVSAPDKTNSLPPSFMRGSGAYPGEALDGFADFESISRLNQTPNTLGLGDTGSMLTAAYSDSYLPGIGSDAVPNIETRILSPEDNLLPPMSGVSRHPSAPHLVSMLTASMSVDRAPSDSMLNEEIPIRKRSWSMPANAHFRLMAPQISISSPDDPMFFDRPETIGETSGGVNTLGDQVGRNLEVSKCLQENKLPSDPSSWSEEQVRAWVEWCIKEFGLQSVDVSKFIGVNGRILCAFQIIQFLESSYIKEHGSRLYDFFGRIKANSSHRPAFLTDPLFPQDFDYTLPMMNNEHLTSPPHGLAPAITIHSTNPLSFPTTSNAMSANGALLIPPPPYGQNRPHSPALSDRSSPYSSPAGSPMPSPGASPFYSPNPSPCPSPSPPMRPHNPSGSGPIQLWQFLLELLTDRDCQNCIAWTGREWEFKLIDPEEVARRWGSRKNKPKMNYEKLSRGLRYYYDKNIIHKVPGKRYVYRFVCDLESMLGMSFTELQHQLKGDHNESVARPIRIERQHYPAQNLIPSPANYGPDMQGLTLNPASPIPSPLNSPFSVSPGMSGSPITHYGPFMPDFQ